MLQCFMGKLIIDYFQLSCSIIMLDYQMVIGLFSKSMDWFKRKTNQWKPYGFSMIFLFKLRFSCFCFSLNQPMDEKTWSFAGSTGKFQIFWEKPLVDGYPHVTAPGLDSVNFQFFVLPIFCWPASPFDSLATKPMTFPNIRVRICKFYMHIYIYIYIYINANLLNISTWFSMYVWHPPQKDANRE